MYSAIAHLHAAGRPDLVEIVQSHLPGGERTQLLQRLHAIDRQIEELGEEAAALRSALRHQQPAPPPFE
ncbi:MAG: hypothetical protein R3B90_20620 [Planctomycetaceae bacterium]